MQLGSKYTYVYTHTLTLKEIEPFIAKTEKWKFKSLTKI